MVFLADEEMAVVTRAGVTFTDFFGRAVSKATQRVLWDPIMAEKAGYKHFMLKEIFEQPTAARETVLGRVSQDTGRVFLEEMKITDAQLAAIAKVTILACSTSWHAGLVGQFLIEQLARLHVDVDYDRSTGTAARWFPPGHVRRCVGSRGRAKRPTHSLPPRGKGGRHLDVTVARRRPHGDARVRDTIYTHAPGPEIGVASTKAFTSQLVALYLLALRLARCAAR